MWADRKKSPSSLWSVRPVLAALAEPGGGVVASSVYEDDRFVARLSLALSPCASSLLGGEASVEREVVFVAALTRPDEVPASEEAPSMTASCDSLGAMKTGLCPGVLGWLPFVTASSSDLVLVVLTSES